MADIYTRMQATASRLLGNYAQGTIVYEIDGPATGPDWSPTPGLPSLYPIDAAASGVTKEYVDGSSILASDLMLVCSVFDVAPSMSGRIVADGSKYQIVKVEQIPAAGTPVAWRIFYRG